MLYGGGGRKRRRVAPNMSDIGSQADFAKSSSRGGCSSATASSRTEAGIGAKRYVISLRGDSQRTSAHGAVRRRDARGRAGWPRRRAREACADRPCHGFESRFRVARHSLGGVSRVARCADNLGPMPHGRDGEPLVCPARGPKSLQGGEVLHQRDVPSPRIVSMRPGRPPLREPRKPTPYAPSHGGGILMSAGARLAHSLLKGNRKKSFSTAGLAGAQAASRAFAPSRRAKDRAVDAEGARCGRCQAGSRSTDMKRSTASTCR